MVLSSVLGHQLIDLDFSIEGLSHRLEVIDLLIMPLDKFEDFKCHVKHSDLLQFVDDVKQDHAEQVGRDLLVAEVNCPVFDQLEKKIVDVEVQLGNLNMPFQFFEDTAEFSVFEVN